uniref:Uncharacterized protein n=1 Tax=Candidatus Kentrum eta TaxID=2126337 RepID=A0A450UA36_9GAMM|nr:MAG: hypothetical protein BECKH772A_GA0070896_1001210 [Candidatus Kentron sp. H]VFJ89792.1 MAG: hypothetical protein BECKH772B_GA0070898_1000648 [Candidatus Kentron sp. H]VFJ97158.1 MAG: hypothetical protein BECKH772C_GA0070978_1001110 [Candidatus Kentron sp. H]
MRYQILIICLIAVITQWLTGCGSVKVKEWEEYRGLQIDRIASGAASISNTTFVVPLRFSGTEEKITTQVTTEDISGLRNTIQKNGVLVGGLTYLILSPIVLPIDILTGFSSVEHESGRKTTEKTINRAGPIPDSIRFSTHLVIRDGYADHIVYNKRATVISENGALRLQIGREFPPCVTYELTIKSFATSGFKGSAPGGPLRATKRGDIGC